MSLSTLYRRVFTAVCTVCWSAIACACLSHHDTASADVNPSGWLAPAVMHYDNTDTVSPRELTLVLRYGVEAESGGCGYIVEAVSPSGLRAVDTLAVRILLAEQGSALREARVPFRSDVKLAETGEYLFTVTPVEETFGVWSVALDFKE